MTALDRGRTLVVAAGLMWSLGGVLTKEVPLAGAALAVYRSLIAGLVLAPLAPRGSRVAPLGLIPLALVFGAMVGCYLESTKATTAANAIFLQCSAIFWTIPMTAVILREPVDRRSMLGIAVASAGIVLILARGADGRPGEGQGIALGLASGVAYAGVVVGLRRYRAVDPTWLAAAVNLGGALALGAYLVVARPGSLPLPRGADVPLLLVFGVVQMAIPYVLFARGLRVVPAPEAALISLLEPALNPLWVFLRQGEAPSAATLMGGSLLLAGVAVRYLPASGRVVKIPASSGGDGHTQGTKDGGQVAEVEAARIEP